jgi:hypothetical protein
MFSDEELDQIGNPVGYEPAASLLFLSCRVSRAAKIFRAATRA